MKTAEAIFTMTKQFYAPQAIAQLEEWKREIQLDAAKSALELAVKKIKFTIDNNDMRQSIITLANDPNLLERLNK